MTKKLNSLVLPEVASDCIDAGAVDVMFSPHTALLTQPPWNGDAVTLERTRVCGDKLFLRTMKTGTTIWCPLPPVVIDSLNAISSAGRYYFWSGNGKAKSCELSKGDESAIRPAWCSRCPSTQIQGHVRSRGAIEWHSTGESVGWAIPRFAVTEKHYAPWVRARQEQLQAHIRRAWESGLIASGETNRTPEVHGKSSRPN